MERMQREKQEPPLGDFVTLYKRWKQTAAFINQNRMLKFKWIQLTEKILGNLLYFKHQGVQSTKSSVNINPYRFYFVKDYTQDQDPERRSLIEDNKSINNRKTYSSDDYKKNSLEMKAERSSYFYLDPSLENSLSSILNIRIPSVKIYANGMSDALAKQFNADALTYQNKIFFKTDKYDPQDKKGIALLGHELTHAAQINMQNLPEATITDYRYEEQEAMDNEKRVLNYLSSVEPYGGNKNTLNYNPDDSSFRSYSSFRGHISNSGAYKGSGSPVSSGTLGNSANANTLNNLQTKPRTALTSRDLNLPSETNADLSAFQLSEQQFRTIKDDIYRDIMNRIKIEFERGG